jgi:hypothetical protein
LGCEYLDDYFPFLGDVGCAEIIDEMLVLLCIPVIECFDMVWIVGVTEGD